jgi:hypothetical protein
LLDLPRLPLTARLATLRHHRRPRHARISASVLSGCFRYRATALPDLPAESHVAVEVGIGAGRIRLPNIRMPEVRPHSNHGCIERPHDIWRAGLACRRVETADLKFRQRSCSRSPLCWLRDIDAALAQNIRERYARPRFKSASIPPTQTTRRPQRSPAWGRYFCVNWNPIWQFSVEI